MSNYTAQLLNSTHVSSIAGVFGFSLVLPLFSLGIVFLVIGITYMRTNKITNAFLSGFIISLIFYFLSPDLIQSSLVAGLAIPLIATALLRLWHNKQQR